MSGETLGGQNQRVEESSLSSWAGPYVTEMLGRGAGLAALPYTAYEGDLTADFSPLQNQAYSGLASLGVPQAFTAGSFTGSEYALPTAEEIAAGATAGEGYYTPASGNVVQQYMNPYLEAALEPQFAGARSDFLEAQRDLQSRYSQAGAYGGSRQGVSEGELASGFLGNLSNLRAQGYQDAYSNAQDMFNKDRNYGLTALKDLAAAGKDQRAVTAEGVAADIAQFEEERDFPYRQVQYMQKLLDGLPLGTSSYNQFNPSGLSSLAGGAADIVGIYDLINKYGNEQEVVTPTGPDMGAYPNATYGNSPTSTATSAGDMGAYPGATYPNTPTVAPTPVTVPRPIAGITT